MLASFWLVEFCFLSQKDMRTEMYAQQDGTNTSFLICNPLTTRPRYTTFISTSCLDLYLIPRHTIIIFHSENSFLLLDVQWKRLDSLSSGFPKRRNFVRNRFLSNELSPMHSVFSRWRRDKQESSRLQCSAHYEQESNCCFIATRTGKKKVSIKELQHIQVFYSWVSPEKPFTIRCSRSASLSIFWCFPTSLFVQVTLLRLSRNKYQLRTHLALT